MNLEDHWAISSARTRDSEGFRGSRSGRGGADGDRIGRAGRHPGNVTRKPNFAALGALTGLNPGKLEGIANGWVPSEKDLSVAGVAPESRPRTTT